MAEQKWFLFFRCSVCSEYFLTEAHLLKHQKLTHFALPFKCTHTQCKESFETADLLEEHQKSAHVKVSVIEIINKISNNWIN